MNLTIGIKALNEEGNIARALETALLAIERTKLAHPLLQGSVLLADSGSSDRTVEIAKRYPVDVVQLANFAERRCGAGAQLAFQYAQGDFFYLMDADMVLSSDFLAEALTFLKINHDVAAVGGLVNECVLTSEEFQIRAGDGKHKHLSAGPVDRLDGGGLYRVDAVREVKFFADRNLHAFEEFELAARLQVNGWKLHRLAIVAVDHYGHSSGGYRLLWRRLKSGYAGGVGEVLRASLGKPHLSFVVRRLSHLRHSVAVLAWWACLLAAVAFSPVAAVFLLVLPILYLSYRRRSVWLGLFSVASWNVAAIGLLSGFFRRRNDPVINVSGVILSAANSARNSDRSTA